MSIGKQGIEEEAAAGPTIASGSYVGTGVSHQETVGFKCSMVVISAAAYMHILIPSATIYHGSHADVVSALYLHAADGFQVGEDAAGANESEATWYWWAISE